MCRLLDNVEKHCRAGQATDDSTVHAHSMLGDYGYRHTLRCVTVIAFPLQQWLHERTSNLRFKFVAGLVLSGRALDTTCPMTEPSSGPL